MNTERLKKITMRLAEQYQFRPSFKKEYPEESYRKLDLWFSHIYLGVFTELVKCLDMTEEATGEKPIRDREDLKRFEIEAPKKKTSQNEKEISKIAENTTTFSTYDKSHPFSSGWNTFRLESVIYLHKIGKSNEEIAKIINSTPVKVKKIISEYEFSQI